MSSRYLLKSLSSDPMRRVSAVVLMGLLACKGGDSPEDAMETAPAQDRPGPTATPEPMSDAPLLKSPSVRATRGLAVRMGPDTKSLRLGTLVTDARTSVMKATKGHGCSDYWYQIRPEGWVCGAYLEADDRLPVAFDLPQVPFDRIVPGEYGQLTVVDAPAYANATQIRKGMASRLISGHAVLRKMQLLKVDNRTYWKTAAGDYVLEQVLKPYLPSPFHGVVLDRSLTVPLVFVMPGPDFKTPAIESPALRPLPSGRAVAAVLERAPIKAGAPKAGYRYRISDTEWLSGPYLRHAAKAERPADVGDQEVWIDINLEEQVLVAYRGDEAIYATLVSSGRRDPTPRGVFRVYHKEAETSMASETGDDRPYLVEMVPWTQFVQAGIALHCAYWHNGFGFRRSRGCVNLAPIDARALYNLTEPHVPPGWSMVKGMKQHPGTLVRMHDNGKTPVHYYGYARDIALSKGLRLPAAPRLADQMLALQGLPPAGAVAPTPSPVPSPPPQPSPAPVKPEHSPAPIEPERGPAPVAPPREALDPEGP